MSANKTQVLLLGIFGLIMFSLVNLFIKTLPLTFTHAVYFCQKILSNVIIFPNFTPFIILLLLSVIFFIGLVVLTVQFFKTQSFIKKALKRSGVFPKKLQNFVKNHALENKINVIENKSQISFCYGLFRPKIYLSTGLIASLNSCELKAVLFHEIYHLKNHDPLRILLGKTASLMLFFIPTLRDIQAHYTFSKEIAADEVVVRNGSRKHLFSALSKLLSQSLSSLLLVASFADSYNLEKRILHLTKQKQTSIGLSKRNLLLSFFAVLLLFIVSSLPVHAIAINDKAPDSSYFMCPFGTISSKNFSEEVLYTPISPAQEERKNGT